MRFLLLISNACANNWLMVAVSMMLGVGVMERLEASFWEGFWWFVPCLAVIFADLLTAKNLAKKNEVKWRWTTAARRTVNKIICYLCWIIFCVSLNHQYDTKLITFVGMAFVFAVEGSSFVNNRLSALGLQLNFQNLLNVFGRRGGIEDLGSIVDKKEDSAK